MTGAELIADERQRQIESEGWSEEHDDQHSSGELSQAGLLYATIASAQCRWDDDGIVFGVPGSWPWSPEWWKPSKDPIRNLAKAGALIAAEIDRLQRIKDRERNHYMLEQKQRQDAINELKNQTVSDPEKFVRCDWCGMEMPKPEQGTPVCEDCMPF